MCRTTFNRLKTLCLARLSWSWVTSRGKLYSHLIQGANLPVHRTSACNCLTGNLWLLAYCRWCPGFPWKLRLSVVVTANDCLCDFILIFLILIFASSECHFSEVCPCLPQGLGRLQPHRAGTLDRGHRLREHPTGASSDGRWAHSHCSSQRSVGGSHPGLQRGLPGEQLVIHCIHCGWIDASCRHTQ